MFSKYAVLSVLTIVASSFASSVSFAESAPTSQALCEGKALGDPCPGIHAGICVGSAPFHCLGESPCLLCQPYGGVWRECSMLQVGDDCLDGGRCVARPEGGCSDSLAPCKTCLPPSYIACEGKQPGDTCDQDSICVGVLTSACLAEDDYYCLECQQTPWSGCEGKERNSSCRKVDGRSGSCISKAPEHCPPGISPCLHCSNDRWHECSGKKPGDVCGGGDDWEALCVEVCADGSERCLWCVNEIYYKGERSGCQMTSSASLTGLVLILILGLLWRRR